MKGLSLDPAMTDGLIPVSKNESLHLDVIPIPCAESLCMVELTPGVMLYVLSSSIL